MFRTIYLENDRIRAEERVVIFRKFKVIVCFRRRRWRRKEGGRESSSQNRELKEKVSSRKGDYNIKFLIVKTEKRFR